MEDAPSQKAERPFDTLLSDLSRQISALVRNAKRAQPETRRCYTRDAALIHAVNPDPVQNQTCPWVSLFVEVQTGSALELVKQRRALRFLSARESGGTRQNGPSQPAGPCGLRTLRLSLHPPHSLL